MWTNGNNSALLVGMQTGAGTMENSMESPQKFKMELPFDPVRIPKHQLKRIYAPLCS